MASVSRLGLGARGVLSSQASARISPRVVRVAPTCSFSTSAALARSVRRANRAPARDEIRSPSAQIAQQKLNQKVTSNAINVIFPGTFVRPPWDQWPKDFSSRFAFFRTWVTVKAREAATKFAMVHSSRPRFFKRAALKTSNPLAILTAKGLHRSMMEALASGDKDTIRKVCASKLALPLQATIDNRPKDKLMAWELVEYTKTWFYPTVLSHKLSPIEKSKDAPIIEQVVVAISSKQRRYQYVLGADGERKKLAGTEKEMDIIENIVIGCVVDPHTWQRDEWRIVGSMKATDPNEWKEEERLVKMVEHSEAMKR
ncbi:hypothetical protein QC763_120410 [Podospora pseudopauciseta]|uniref:Tim44-like domain-containing protein n=2 Tax=Podospora TaxID=5144 RepID=A0ABR0I2H8_9PEZI|nr:hypothetical protein QC763_120410 [Podospora pseudopauciseta]KAK4682911.1 hypothetical protein QC764_120410 [Podospora pseudoanserina]